MRLGRKNKKTESIKTVQTVLRETRNNSPIFSRFAIQTRTERQLYTTLRESVPIIDAALCKIIRLIGGFKIVTSSAESQKIADSFVKNVRTNGEMMGLESFVLCYLDSLLTYGQAVGEIVPDSGGEGICALYNASLDDVEIRADSSPLKLAVYTLGNGTAEEPKHPSIIVKGIVSLLVRVLSGHTPDEILNAHLYFIDRIGLNEHLSPTRSNGLVAMVKQMRMYALAFKVKNN